ncbi:MAG: DUF4357 domain-containing protein, partial [bacterium]
ASHLRPRPHEQHPQDEPDFSAQSRTSIRADGRGGLVFTRDHLFQTPSGAAIALMARRANGWTEWKNAAGLTLHQLQREPQGCGLGCGQLLHQLLQQGGLTGGGSIEAGVAERPGALLVLAAGDADQADAIPLGACCA